MSKSINIFQAIFVALLVFKIGEVPPYKDFSWFTVAIPLILGTIAGIITRILEVLEISGRIKDHIAVLYLERVQRKAVRKAQEQAAKDFNFNKQQNESKTSR